MLVYENLSILLNLLYWIVITGVVGTCLHQASIKSRLNPSAWWGGLVISLSVFIPVPQAVLSQNSNFNWVQNELSLADATNHLRALAQVELPLFTGSFQTWILVLIAAISLWRLNRLLRNHRKLRQLVGRGIPFEPATSHFPTYLTSLRCSAFATGVVRPVVALPEYFLTLTRHQQRIVLAHEYNHIRLGDPISLLAWRVIGQLFWFNPFLQILERGHNNSIELRCDAKTLQQEQCSPTAYARTLLTCLKIDTARSSHELTVGFTSGISLQDYKFRLKNVLANTETRTNMPKLSGLFILFMATIMSVNSVMAGLGQSQEKWQYPVSQPSLSARFGHIAALRAFKPHQGIDLKGPVGTPVYASASGTVAFADDNTLSSGYGLTIMLEHPQHWQSMYAHLSEVHVKPGQHVSQGDIIGLMGQSGRVNGPHLHFEIAHQAKSVDPLQYLQPVSEAVSLHK